MKENMREFLKFGWRRIQPDSLDIEIKSTMIRNEIENVSFQISFMDKVPLTY